MLSCRHPQCGCKCTQCCFEGNANNCTVTEFGTCPYTCLKKDPTQCGIEYSSVQQSFFCQIAHPSSWPALLQVPRQELRAEPYRPDPVLLYTGADQATADVLSAGLIPPPNITLGRLQALQRYQREYNATMGSSMSTVPGELLSLLGLTLGTAAKSGPGLYLEPGLVRVGGAAAVGAAARVWWLACAGAAAAAAAGTRCWRGVLVVSCPCAEARGVQCSAAIALRGPLYIVCACAR